MKTFVWTCNFHGLEAQGVGRSKKEAKIAAAKALKDQIDVAALPPVSEKKRKAPPAREAQSPSQKKKRFQEQRQFGQKGFGFGQGFGPGQGFGRGQGFGAGQGFGRGEGFGPNGALPVPFAELYSDVGPEGGVMAPVHCQPGGYGGGPGKYDVVILSFNKVQFVNCCIVMSASCKLLVLSKVI